MEHEESRPDFPSLDTAVLSFDDARKQLLQMVSLFESEDTTADQI